MTLEEVIAKARREWQSAHNEALAKAGHAPDNRIQPSDDVIANAVRAFLGSEEVVAAGREAILENLRDRRLLKWLFAEDPENHGAIGYVDGPIDAETQNECAESLARATLSSIGGE